MPKALRRQPNSKIVFLPNICIKGPKKNPIIENNEPIEKISPILSEGILISFK